MQGAHMWGVDPPLPSRVCAFDTALVFCCENAQTRELYACAFGQMIDGWRAAWNAPMLPFGFVQLSSWSGNWGFDDMSCAALLKTHKLFEGGVGVLHFALECTNMPCAYGFLSTHRVVFTPPSLRIQYSILRT